MGRWDPADCKRTHDSIHCAGCLKSSRSNAGHCTCGPATRLPFTTVVVPMSLPYPQCNAVSNQKGSRPKATSSRRHNRRGVGGGASGFGNCRGGFLLSTSCTSPTQTKKRGARMLLLYVSIYCYDDPVALSTTAPLLHWQEEPSLTGSAASDDAK